MAVPSYIAVPSCATPISLPRGPSGASAPVPGTAKRSASVSIQTGASGNAYISANLNSGVFPPAAATVASPQRRFTVPTTSSISSNVSDLVLSSLLPPNIPKVAATHTPGRVRELTSQKESLGLNVMSGNFTRFIIKVGPVFWLQDRVEEVLFWHKPVWTWAWMFTWTFICFYPRVLLFLPSAVVLIIYLSLREQKVSLPSLFGVTLPPPHAGSMRVGGSNDPAAFSASTAPESEGAPVVPPKEAESSVDYYMNMQAIQNLMGMVSDLFDTVTPYLSFIAGKDTSPTSFPLTPTLVLLALLPPTLFLPLTPVWALPYLLLPAGLLPPLYFHPNLTPYFTAIPNSMAARKARVQLEDLALTDALPDSIGSRAIARVEAWENERLDPAAAAKPVSTPLPPGSWSSRFLRAAERDAWVKVRSGPGSSLWADDDPDSDDGRMAMALKDKWAFVPGEDWKVDVAALWCEGGADPDGWAYSDDSWQQPTDKPVDDTTPGLPARRVTRRRRWWRRVYLTE